MRSFENRKPKNLQDQLASTNSWGCSAILRVEIGRDLLLDDLPTREEGKGYVSVAESSFVWKEGKGLGVKTFKESRTNNVL